MGVDLRGWATRKLRSGDLTALSAIASGRAAEETREQRLLRRGFVCQHGDGRLGVTTLGRVALVIKRLIPR